MDILTIIGPDNSLDTLFVVLWREKRR